MNGDPNKAAPAGGSPATGELSSEDRVWALVSHIIGLVGPLVAYLVRKDQSKYVRFHAIQAFAFHLAVFAVYILMIPVIFILALVTAGWAMVLLAPLLGLVGLAFCVYAILMCIKAYKGEFCKYPVVGEWAYKKVYEQDWKPL